MDVPKQIRYWQEGSDEEWDVAQLLLEHKKYRQALSWGHLAVEKIIKALVARATKTAPPKSHQLAYLAAKVDFAVPTDIMDKLRVLNEHQMEGRYPAQHRPTLSPQTARSEMAEMERVREWFKKQL